MQLIENHIETSGIDVNRPKIMVFSVWFYYLVNDRWPYQWRNVKIQAKCTDKTLKVEKHVLLHLQCNVYWLAEQLKTVK